MQNKGTVILLGCQGGSYQHLRFDTKEELSYEEMRADIEKNLFPGWQIKHLIRLSSPTAWYCEIKLTSRSHRAE